MTTDARMNEPEVPPENPREAEARDEAVETRRPETPEKIYLEPVIGDPAEGRLWCEDDDPAGTGEPWVEYVRADVVKAIVDDNPAADALDDLWRDVILARRPGYGDWEYPGQAYRHLLAEFEDLGAKARLGAVVEAFLAWADETFPDATPETCVAHLRSEVEELSEEGGARDPEELADAAMLVFHAAHKGGIDLVDALRAKLKKNEGRKWGPPNAEGYREHVRE